MAAPDLVVVGAGPMGLAAAYYAAKAGKRVVVLEADDRVGGMAAHFDLDGLSIERFYHFCCLSDVDTLELMAEVGFGGAMRWRRTTMGFVAGGVLHDWGDPLALLKFPGLDPVQKLRYGLQALTSTRREDWRRLDAISAEDWFIAWCGRSAYEKMWRPLIALKFHEHAGEVSAAWMWRRIKRLGASRASLFEERLGHIEGGSQPFMEAVAGAVRAAGGDIRLRSPARRFLIEQGGAVGVELMTGERVPAPNVISTVPTPYVASMLDQAPAGMADAYRRIRNIGCVCVVLKLRRPVTRHFWVNISDPRSRAPGFVEFSNLRTLPDTVVYAPFYMPSTHARFSRSDDDFVAETLAALRLAAPALSRNDVLAAHVGRLRHAQPVCEVGFADLIPPAQTQIAGLQIADTCFYYPEDRGMSESIRYGRRLAADATRAVDVGLSAAA